MKRRQNKARMKGCGTGQPSLSVAQLVAAAELKVVRTSRCILCTGHPWAEVITKALKKGVSIRGLFRALQEEGVKDVTLNTIRNHKAAHLKDS